MVSSEIFREYDIRGVVGRDFTEDFAYQLGQTFVTYLRERGAPQSPVITLGHDARHSSPVLERSLSQGMCDAGARVLTLGLVTTPISYFSMFHIPETSGGIMITGSHNPPEYNGFKISVGRTTMFGEEIQTLRKIMERGSLAQGKGTIEKYDIFAGYLARYRQEFSDLPKIKVVLDCGNGAAGCIARQLYEGVGLEPVILFEDPDGRFPNHHPDPTVEENLDALKKAVRESQAALGIGFDGDADRIGVVDNHGRFILGDELMVMISRSILETQPGSKIIGDVKCSDRLFDDIRNHGGEAIMWKTGHSLVKNKIKLEKAPFGGELSGHIFFSDRNYGFDDALYAGLRLVEIIGKSGRSISELLADLPTAYNTPEIRIDTTETKKREIVDKLKSVFHSDTSEYKVNFIDGIRISFSDGWALARSSNTQPVLVLRFEAQSPERLSEIQERIEKIVRPML